MINCRFVALLLACGMFFGIPVSVSAAPGSEAPGYIGTSGDDLRPDELSSSPEAGHVPSKKTIEEDPYIPGESETGSRTFQDEEKGSTSGEAGPLGEMSMSDEKSGVDRAMEVQFEYLKGRFFDNRRINRYQTNLLWKLKGHGSFSLHGGLTISRMTGYTTDEGIWRDSGAWGLGPMVMVRWEKKLSGKLSGALEASGSIQGYSKAHPARGRAFGFLWRIGPRLIYRFTDRDAVSLGYIFHHTSNGMSSKNPGYNGIGFSLGYQWGF